MDNERPLITVKTDEKEGRQTDYGTKAIYYHKVDMIVHFYIGAQRVIFLLKGAVSARRAWP